MAAGFEAIPERWLSRLELTEVISEVGNDLSRLSERGTATESMLGKYPPGLEDRTVGSEAKVGA
jgi:hypothetical protein